VRPFDPLRPRPPRFRRPRSAASLVVALVTFAVWRFFHGVDDRPGVPDAGPSETRRVVRVIDGDTFVIGENVRVRLLGVDAPDFGHPDPDRPDEPFGREATEFLRAAVDGRDVRLDFDRERHDKYDRLLAYVTCDDRLVNAEIIRAGFAKALTRFPFSAQKKRLFVEAEREAREAQRGLWSTTPASPDRRK
jgi:micrococcal nuclease